MRVLALCCATLLGSAIAPVNAQEYPATIAAYAEHQGGNVIYHYEIRNNGPVEIRRFYIGCECRDGLESVAQLQALPTDAHADRADDLYTWYQLTRGQTEQPAGWRVRIARPQGTSGHWVEWYAPAARPGAGIPSGRSLAGFRLVVPGPDDAYLSGRFTVQPEGRPSGSGSLALLDTTPPTLTLETRTATEQSGATALVRVVATAKDDRDREPRIVVEAVNRAEGTDDRAYVVVYSATDASGNRSMASTQVRLPAGSAPPAPGTPSMDPRAPERPPAAPAPTKTNLPRLAALP